MSAISRERPTSDRSIFRFLTFGLVFLLAVSGLTTRLVYLQITHNGQYTQLAQANRSEIQAIPSSRGLIYDRNGAPLVTNVPSFAVKIRPADLPLSQRETVVERLSSLLGIEAVEINTTLDSNPGSRFDLVRIAQDVPEATARLIAEERAALPGVQVSVEARRQYLEGPLFAHTLGYTAAISAEELARLKSSGYLPDDLIGRMGVEATYESELRGTYGQEEVEKDASGRKLKVLRTVTPAQAGNSLVLTLDTREQKLAQQALEWAIRTAKLKRGAIMVMNPQTGELLAMVSLPSYDDNLFARGISTATYKKLLNDPGQPLINHAIADQHPPGSTYKLVTGTGGLADRKITPKSRLQTKPYLTLGSYKFVEWNNRGWGPLTIFDAFGHSSDTFFYQVAGMLGIDRLGYWGKRFGFGQKTGIDLPGEVAGVVPTNQWKLDTLGEPIYPGEVYQSGIGQGYNLITPIQLITAYSALANGGTLYRPQIVREVVGPDGNIVRAFEPEVVREDVAPPSVLKTMRNAARTVVTIRHMYNMVDLPVRVAAKSGTAEFGVRDEKGRLPYHSWFAGFVPKDPYKGSFDDTTSQLAVVAFAYDSRTVGNVATEIGKYFFMLHFGIKRDYRLPQLLERGNFYGD